MENLAPTGIRSPDRPARSESLYRLISRPTFWYKSILNYKQSMPLHVSANLVAILREVHYKGYITKVYEPMAGYNVVNVNSVWFQMHVIMSGFEGLVG